MGVTVQRPRAHHFVQPSQRCQDGCLQGCSSADLITSGWRTPDSYHDSIQNEALLEYKVFRPKSLSGRPLNDAIMEVERWEQEGWCGHPNEVMGQDTRL